VSSCYRNYGGEWQAEFAYVIQTGAGPVRYSQRVRLGYSDAMRADKALQGQAADIPTTLPNLSL
jgi:hypothetical protein